MIRTTEQFWKRVKHQRVEVNKREGYDEHVWQNSLNYSAAIHEAIF